MAVYAAHLTRSFQGTPSVFQVTAQEALGTTLKPALRKVIEVSISLYYNLSIFKTIPVNFLTKIIVVVNLI